MLSMILSQPDSNETSFTDLQDVAVVELGVSRRLVAVDAHATLVDEPPRLGAALRKLDLDERLDQVLWFRYAPLGHRFGHVAPAELAVEVGLGPRRRLLPMQSLHHLASHRGFAVPRLQCDHSAAPRARHPSNHSVVLLF